jgi:hypothetical protein
MITCLRCRRELFALDRDCFRLLGQLHELHQRFLALAQLDWQFANEVGRDPRRVFRERFLRRWQLVRHRLHRAASRHQSLNHQLRVLRARQDRLLQRAAP